MYIHISYIYIYIYIYRCIIDDTPTASITGGLAQHSARAQSGSTGVTARARERGSEGAREQARAGRPAGAYHVGELLHLVLRGSLRGLGLGVVVVAHTLFPVVEGLLPERANAQRSVRTERVRRQWQVERETRQWRAQTCPRERMHSDMMPTGWPWKKPVDPYSGTLRSSTGYSR